MRTMLFAAALALLPAPASAEPERDGSELSAPNMAREAFATLDLDRRRRSQDRPVDSPVYIPPGHQPPPGHCRDWDPNLPAGHQPPPYRC